MCVHVCVVHACVFMCVCMHVCSCVCMWRPNISVFLSSSITSHLREIHIWFVSVHMTLCLNVRMHARACVEVKGQLSEVCFLLPSCGAQTWVIRRGSKWLYPLICLTDRAFGQPEGHWLLSALCLCSRVLGLQAWASAPGPLHGCWRSKPRSSCLPHKHFTHDPLPQQQLL